MTPSIPSVSSAASFEETVVAVMSDLRQTLDALVEAVGGVNQRGVDIARALKIDNKLAWQIVRLAAAEEPLAEITNVPSATSVQRLLLAVRKHPNAKALAVRTADAFEAFEQCVARFGEDRDALISMVNGLGRGADGAFEIKMRRTVFRGQAYLWGLQARTLCRTSIVLPCELGRPNRHVLISGNIGVQRVREGMPVTLSSWARRGVPGSQVSAEELARAGEVKPAEVAFMPEFCTQPLPQVFTRLTVGSAVEVEMALPSTGLAGAATLYFCHELDNATDPRIQPYGLRIFVSLPVEEIVTDFLVPAGWLDPANARVTVYGRRHHPEHVYDERPNDILSQRESITYLGTLKRLPRIPSAPAHADAVEHMLDKHGCSDVVFDAFRCRVQYPILHSLIAMHLGRQHPPGPPQP